MTPSAKLKQLWDARIAEITRERDDLTARLAAAEAEVAGKSSECIYCRDVLDVDDVNHWETCEKHPARQRLAASEAERDALADTCVEAADQIDTLRGLLREAVEAWHSAAYRRTFLDWRGNMEWGKKAQAALEGKL